MSLEDATYFQNSCSTSGIFAFFQARGERYDPTCHYSKYFGGHVASRIYVALRVLHEGRFGNFPGVSERFLPRGDASLRSHDASDVYARFELSDERVRREQRSRIRLVEVRETPERSPPTGAGLPLENFRPRLIWGMVCV
jgi:hypothetical protein